MQLPWAQEIWSSNLHAPTTLPQFNRFLFLPPHATEFVDASACLTCWVPPREETGRREHFRASGGFRWASESQFCRPARNAAAIPGQATPISERQKQIDELWISYCLGPVTAAARSLAAFARRGKHSKLSRRFLRRGGQGRSGAFAQSVDRIDGLIR